MKTGNRVLLGTRKGALVYELRGDEVQSDEWTLVSETFPGTQVTLFEVDFESGTLFALLDDGHFGVKLHRAKNFLSDSSDFSSLEWEELSAPKYPENSKLKKVGDAEAKDAVAKYLWAFTCHKGRLFIGTEPGGLFVSNDLGESFEFVESLWNHPSRTADNPGWMGGGRDNPAIHSVCVDPRDEATVLIGISVAGVFGSDGNLNSWKPMNKGLKAEFLPDPYPEVGHDPHLLVQCQSNPEIIWQQNHCGVFVSSDGAANWEDVSAPDVPVNFGFLIQVDPDDGDTAWVVPATSDMNRVAVDKKMCVCRTTDRGKTWTAFREGLPQKDCYDFAFRHAMDQSGDRLIFGTACGSLYVSENRGESWKTIANHLPPIYSVRMI